MAHLSMCCVSPSSGVVVREHQWQYGDYGPGNKPRIDVYMSDISSSHFCRDAEHPRFLDAKKTMLLEDDWNFWHRVLQSGP